MKKTFSAIIAAVFLCSFALHAQETEQCVTTQVYKERIKNHPEVLVAQQQLEQHTQRYNARVAQGNHTAAQVYIIPIVFHIIHNYGSENISDAEVEDQVRILNDDYRKRSYDTADIIPQFKPIAADCEIEFRLATIDPQGHCTNGIDRIASMRTYQAGDYSKLNPWPDDQYLNVWVVTSIAMQGAAAYAYYPGTAPPGADGVIMLSTYVGSIGASSIGHSRVLTHEIGHYLNLQHVWGDTNDPGIACGDDQVFDTPITKGWSSCNLNGISCGGPVENVQNYMEYSYCCNMFTEGQKTRMRAALTSGINGRDNLWSTSNLIATGTNGSVTQLCPPVADFNANLRAFCDSGSVQYKDASWNSMRTSWNWSFPGGNPSFSTDSMPVVQYSIPGNYNATLIAGNSAGSDSITKTSFIRVGGSPSQNAPYFESFEFAGSFPGADAYVVNPDGGNTWTRVTNAGSTGSACIMINNFSGNAEEEVDDYITPSFDLSGATALVLGFKLAYAQRLDTVNDVLQVYASINCGHTWTLRYTKPGHNLATTGNVITNFVPGAADWRQEYVNIIPFHNQPNVRFRFRNTSATGNNVYIDDINITGVLAGVGENPGSDPSFTVFPNPSPGNFFVIFDLGKQEKVSLKVTDALGREVKTLANAVLLPGAHQYSVDKNLEAGIYFVILEKEGKLSAEKLMITKE